MAYRLYQFDSQALPTAHPTTDAGTGQIQTFFLDLPGGGAFDLLGSERARRKVTPLHQQCLITGNSAASMRTQYNALRAYLGERKRLWRRWDDGTLEWCWARLTNIACEREVEQYRHLDIDLQFTMISPYWHGTLHTDGWFLDSGLIFDSGYILDTTGTVTLTTSPQSATIINGGNRPATNIRIVITAGTVAISYLRIVCGSHQIEYRGNIASTKALEIDCGEMSVEDDGADDYANFSLMAGHTKEDWLSFAVGANTVTLTWTGGGTGSTALFEFCDAWE